MKLKVRRNMEKDKNTGFMGMGKDKIVRTFTINLKLEDVSEEEKELLDLYTYITKDGNKERYMELPIFLFEEDRYQWLQRNNLIKGGRHVRVKELMKGSTWEASGLFEDFVEIPDIVSNKLEEILTDIKVGKLWTEDKGGEVINIEDKLS